MAGPTCDFDAVVIGSGMGGLTAAALLARVARPRVLVLERHWRAGADAVRPGMLRDVLRVTTWIPWTPGRFDLPFLQARTPVAGLFLTGADALFPGISGTAMSGLMTAAAIARPGLFGRVRREARAIDATAGLPPGATAPSAA